MCFSAIASFGAGTVLTVVGYASIRKVNSPNQYPFAYIPIFFAIQQFAEGALWLIIPGANHPELEEIYTTIFLVTAQVIWPVWVPLSILLLEKNKMLRTILSFLTAVGIIVSMVFAWCIIVYGSVARIDGHHICYEETYPIIFSEIGGYFYVMVTVLPTFFSRFKKIWILGLTICISYLITKIYYDNYLISVWCFFAAIISIIIYFAMDEIKSKSFDSHQPERPI
ncbi:MAG: hypothetical protein M0D53_12150 [Flavobacterium sp. JAD_PAG50586_2]|nr:MAG: hypothetical protein M0D53_12150 [Flavobacterium sp. JAD_PAG50586_2]